jgi:competence protein ComEC
MGFILSYWSQPINYYNHFSNFLKKDKQVFYGYIASEPRLSGSIIKAELEVLQLDSSQLNNHHLCGKVILSIKLDSTASKLKYGDGILFSSKIKDVNELENPNAFDQKFYYERLGIYHQAYLRENDWQRFNSIDLKNDYWALLISWRTQLNSIFDSFLKNNPNEHAVASALILGSRSSFSKELVNAYADTGATHVLSVSGLHVGLLATLLSMLLSKLSKFDSGSRFKKFELIALLSIIWFYALISGASAAVLRSAVMFTFVFVGKSLSRKISIYNSLAASAFFLLCWHPNLVWDIGFQLSYLALTGIVFFHPIIYKQIFIKNKILDWIWNITAVGIAAQIATLPISLYYFHQFPSYFWLSGLIVIPLSTIALYAGFALLLFSWIPFLNLIIAKILYFSIYLMNALVFIIQKLPFSVIDGFNLSIFEMWISFFLIFALILSFLLKLRYWTLISFLIIVLLSGSFLTKKLYNFSNDEIFVYKINKGTLIDFYKDHSAISLVDTLNNNVSKINYVNGNNLIRNDIVKSEILSLYNDEINNSTFKINKNGMVFFNDVRLAIPPKEFLNSKISMKKKPTVDYLLLTSNPRIKDINSLENLFNYKILVFDASNSHYRISSWINQCSELGIPYIDCSKRGRDILSEFKK